MPPDARRVAIVTGAARGIGAATVEALRADGLVVVGFDVLQTGDSQATMVDVSDAAAVNSAVAEVLDRYGRIDVLVNNAGVLAVDSVEESSEDAWDRVMAVNVKSVFLMSRAVLPHLRSAGGGSIVNMSSVHAYATVGHTAAYAASKGAVLALTRQMALDCYDDGIRVNTLVVGSVDTAMSAQHGVGLARAGVSTPVPGGSIGRSADPREIAATVVFLCSPHASFITGSPVIADGGMLARLV